MQYFDYSGYLIRSPSETDPLTSADLCGPSWTLAFKIVWKVGNGVDTHLRARRTMIEACMSTLSFAKCGCTHEGVFDALCRGLLKSDGEFEEESKESMYVQSSELGN